jgi:hypothetical protein
MKTIFYFFSIILIALFFTSQNYAQVTNLVVNGASPGQTFTLESGGEMTWLYNVPNLGDTALVQVYLDVNGDRIIDSGDKVWQQFNQIDGDTVGQNGPPDVDGIKNGSVSLSNFLLGMAPADYIIKVTNKGVGQMVAGTITSLTNVAYTISGKVSVPSGVDPSNIFVELNRNEKFMPFFWQGLTDAHGNYTIKITSDTAGNPWTLELVEGQFSGSQITPADYQVTVDSNKTNLNFTVTASDAKVVGTLRDEIGNPIPFQNVTLQDVNNVNRHYVDTDINGFFQFGLSSSELNGQKWFLQALFTQDDITTTLMDPRIELKNVIVKGDSINQDLTAYTADTTITGTVSFLITRASFGGNNTNVPRILIIASTDSTESYAHNDTTTGNYILRVSSKIAAYTLFCINLPSGYNPITLNDIPPGATNVNFVFTDVKKRTSTIPKSFSLSQNYPNPFNPTTNINYDIPNNMFVNITVYNELGQKVITLVNKKQKAGKYVVSFNASNLSSGVYFYQLKTKDFVQIKKMILLK